MAAAMHVIGIINSSPRLPSLREEINRWQEKKLQKRLHDMLKAKQVSNVESWPTASQILPLTSEKQDGYRILGDISSEWHGKLEDTSSPIVAEFGFFRTLETEIPTLVANIQPGPGSHLSSRTVEAKFPPLSAPVLIPQRSPRFKRAGFVEAYAPILGQYGVGQNAFSRFIQGLEKVMRAAPRLEALDSFGTHPGLRDVSRTDDGLLLPNRYLEEANQQWLASKGLRAYFMRLNPYEERDSGEKPAIHASLPQGTTGLDLFSMLKQSPANTPYDEELASASRKRTSIRAQCAALIFPGLERAAIQASQGNTLEVDALRKVYADHADLLNQYFERRTRMLAPVPSSRISRKFSRPSNARTGHPAVALSKKCQDHETFRILDPGAVYLVIASDGSL